MRSMGLMGFDTTFAKKLVKWGMLFHSIKLGSTRSIMIFLYILN